MSFDSSHDVFKNKFFNGLTEDQLLTIDYNRFIRTEYDANTKFITQDTPGSVMYLISSGDVLITKDISGNECALANRTGGDYVGEMALFDGHLRSANVITVSDTVVYAVDEMLFFELFNNFEQIKVNLIQTINTTIRETGVKLGETVLTHDEQISRKNSELDKTRNLLNETIELKRYIDEQKSELELINSELEKRNKELYQLTIIDDLTRLYSNSHFKNILDREFSRSKKYAIDLSVLLIDIDNFRKFNDDYGHFTGDRILKESAAVIATHLDSEDIAGRLEGGSFGIITPHKDLEYGKGLAERLRESIEENKILLVGTEQNITVSAGVCDIKTSNVDNPEQLIQLTKKKLSEAKSNGKNSVAF